jgi:hypothetical protein
MAYQLADPAPFMPRGFQSLQVQGRRWMNRAVVRRTPALYEEWAILTFDPLPRQEVHFANIREVVLEFLQQHKRVQVRDTQRTHLGQALVGFQHVYDRGNLIA